MAENIDKRKALYDALSEEYDLGTQEEFNAKMGDVNKRKVLYEAIKEDYDVGETFEEFEKRGNFSSYYQQGGEQQPSTAAGGAAAGSEAVAPAGEAAQGQAAGAAQAVNAPKTEMTDEERAKKQAEMEKAKKAEEMRKRSFEALKAAANDMSWQTPERLSANIDLGLHDMSYEQFVEGLGDEKKVAAYNNIVEQYYNYGNKELGVVDAEAQKKKIDMMADAKRVKILLERKRYGEMSKEELQNVFNGQKRRYPMYRDGKLEKYLVKINPADESDPWFVDSEGNVTAMYTGKGSPFMTAKESIDMIVANNIEKMDAIFEANDYNAQATLDEFIKSSGINLGGIASYGEDEKAADEAWQRNIQMLWDSFYARSSRGQQLIDEAMDVAAQKEKEYNEAAMAEITAGVTEGEAMSGAHLMGGPALGAIREANQKYDPERKAAEDGWKSIADVLAKQGISQAQMLKERERYMSAMMEKYMSRGYSDNAITYVLGNIVKDTFIADSFARLMRTEYQQQIAEKTRATDPNAGHITDTLSGIGTFMLEGAVLYNPMGKVATTVTKWAGNGVAKVLRVVPKNSEWIGRTAAALVESGEAANMKAAKAIAAKMWTLNYQNSVGYNYLMTPLLSAGREGMTFGMADSVKALTTGMSTDGWQWIDPVAQGTLETDEYGNIVAHQNKGILNNIEHHGALGFFTGAAMGSLRPYFALLGHGANGWRKAAANVTGFGAGVTAMTAVGAWDMLRAPEGGWSQYDIMIDQEERFRSQMRAQAKTPEEMEMFKPMTDNEKAAAKWDMIQQSFFGNLSMLGGFHVGQVARLFGGRRYSMEEAHNAIINENARRRQAGQRILTGAEEKAIIAGYLDRKGNMAWHLELGDIAQNIRSNINEMGRTGRFEKSMRFTDYDKRMLEQASPELVKAFAQIADGAERIGKAKTLADLKLAKDIVNGVMKLGSENAPKNLLAKVLYRITGRMVDPGMVVNTEIKEQEVDGRLVCMLDAYGADGELVDRQMFATPDDALRAEAEYTSQKEQSEITKRIHSIATDEVNANFYRWLAEDYNSFNARWVADAYEMGADGRMVFNVDKAAATFVGNGSMAVEALTEHQKCVAIVMRAVREGKNPQLVCPEELENVLSDYYGRTTRVREIRRRAAEQLGVSEAAIEMALEGHNAQEAKYLDADAVYIGNNVYRTREEQQMVDVMKIMLKEATEMKSNVEEERDNSVEAVKSEIKAVLSSGQGGTPILNRMMVQLQMAHETLRSMGISPDEALQVSTDTNRSEAERRTAMDYLKARDALSAPEEAVAELVEAGMQEKQAFADAIENVSATDEIPMNQVVRGTFRGDMVYVWKGHPEADDFVVLKDEAGNIVTGPNGEELIPSRYVENLQVVAKDQFLKADREGLYDLYNQVFAGKRFGMSIEMGETFADKDGKTYQVANVADGGASAASEGGAGHPYMADRGEKMVTLLDESGESVTMTAREAIEMRTLGYKAQIEKENSAIAERARLDAEAEAERAQRELGGQELQGAQEAEQGAQPSTAAAEGGASSAYSASSSASSVSSASEGGAGQPYMADRGGDFVIVGGVKQFSRLPMTEDGRRYDYDKMTPGEAVAYLEGDYKPAGRLGRKKGYAGAVAKSELDSAITQLNELNSAEVKGANQAERDMLLVQAERDAEYLQRSVAFWREVLDESGRRQYADKEFTGVIDSFESYEMQKKAPEMHEWMTEMAKAVGYKVGMVDSRARAEMGSGANGKNDLDRLTIWLNMYDAGQDISPEQMRLTYKEYVGQVFGHELTHTFFKQDANLMERFIEQTRSYLGEEQFGKMMDDKIRTYLSKAAYSEIYGREDLSADEKREMAYERIKQERQVTDESGRRYLEEEVACDMAGQLMADNGYARELLIGRMPKEDLDGRVEEAEANVLQRIAKGLESALNWVLGYDERIAEPKTKDMRAEQREALKDTYARIFDTISEEWHRNHRMLAEKRGEYEVEHRDDYDSVMTERYEKENAVWAEIAKPIEDAARERVNTLERIKDPMKRWEKARELYRPYGDDLAYLFTQDALEPRTLEEHVSGLQYHSLAWEDQEVGGRVKRGLKYHLGDYSKKRGGDADGFRQFLAAEGKGRSFDEVVHDIYTGLPDFLHENPDVDVREALLNVLQSSNSAAETRHMIVLNRLKEAEEQARYLDDEAIKREFTYGYKWVDGELVRETPLEYHQEVINQEMDHDFRQESECPFSLRTEPAPKVRKYGFKAFKIDKDGNLYPPMVENFEGRPTDLGLFLNAEAGTWNGRSTTGRAQVRAKGGSSLSYRPAWHLGYMPNAKQFYGKGVNEGKAKGDIVWALVEFDATNDYSLEADAFGVNKNGAWQHSLTGAPFVPENGYYEMRTNPNPSTDAWALSGSMRVVRMLSRGDETSILAKSGVKKPELYTKDMLSDEMVERINKKINDNLLANMSGEEFLHLKDSVDKAMQMSFEEMHDFTYEDTESTYAGKKRVPTLEEWRKVRSDEEAERSFRYNMIIQRGGEEAEQLRQMIAEQKRLYTEKNAEAEDARQKAIEKARKAKQKELKEWFTEVNKDVKFSEREISEIEVSGKRFDDELEAYKRKEHNGLLHLGEPKALLNACGVNAPELTMSPKVLRQHLKKHNLKADDLRGLAVAIQNPILVYKHGKTHPNIVVVTDMDIEGKKLSVAVEIDEHGNVKELNNVRSVHAKQADVELERLAELSSEELANNLRWVNKEKVSDWLLRLPYEDERTISNQRLNDIAKVIRNFENPEVSSEDYKEINTDSQDFNNSLRGNEEFSYREIPGESGAGHPYMADRGEAPVIQPGESLLDYSARLKAWRDALPVRFSARDLKTDKSLVGVHNITVDKLAKALKLGGLANPSMAVINADKRVHEGFGEVSFVAPSALMDKYTGRNAGTWMTDAYTQLYPRVERLMSDAGKEKFEKWLDKFDLPKDDKIMVEMRTRSALLDGRTHPEWGYMYLKERGIDTSIFRSDLNNYNVDEAFSKYGDADGVMKAMESDEHLRKYVMSKAKEVYTGDAYDRISKEVREELIAKGEKVGLFSPKLSRAIKPRYQKVLQEVFGESGEPNAEQVREVLEGMERTFNETKKLDLHFSQEYAESYIRDNGMAEQYNKWRDKLLERFDVQGRLFRGFKRNGDRIYKPETLENVSKAMNEDAEGNDAGSEMVSFGSFVSKLTGHVDSLEEMRANKERLTNNSDKQAFYDEWIEVYNDLVKELDSEIFYGERKLHDIVGHSDMKRYAKKEYGITLSKKFMDNLEALKKAVREDMNTAYFETKFHRPVTLDEFTAALMPKGTPAAITKALRESGLKVFKYDPEKEGDRERAFNRASKMEGVRFSEREAEYLDAAMAGDMEAAQKMVKEAAKRAFPNTKVVDENGYPKVVYHGSPNGGITTFDINRKKTESSGLKEFGSYFTDNIELAKLYQQKALTPEFLEEVDGEIARYREMQDGARNVREYDAYENEINRLEAIKEGKVYPVFLNITEPKEFDAEGKDGSKAFGGWRNLKEDVGYDVKRGTEAVEAIFGHNSAYTPNVKYDGIIAHNIIDLEGEVDARYLGNVYLVPNDNPNAIKSAAPVTYDNNGNVIPLSERFNVGNSDIRYSIAGERGAAALDKAEEATVRMDNLGVAREMEEAGKDAKTIRLATGWERGADGKWRYEIEDTIIPNDAEIGKGAGFKLGSFVGGDELFKAYPELKDIGVIYDPYMSPRQYGSYNYVNNILRINANLSKSEKRRALLHEMQHAIQFIEGFAEGSSVRGLLDKIPFDKVYLMNTLNAYSGFIEVLKAYKEEGLDVASEYLDVYSKNKYQKEWIEDSTHFFNLVADWICSRATNMYTEYEVIDEVRELQSVEPTQRGDFLKRNMDSILGAMENKYREDNDFFLKNKKFYGDELTLYKRVSGEVEARNAEARRDMSPVQRKAMLLAESEDVAREDQIFVKTSSQYAEMAYPYKYKSDGGAGLPYMADRGGDIAGRGGDGVEGSERGSLRQLKGETDEQFAQRKADAATSQQMNLDSEQARKVVTQQIKQMIDSKMATNMVKSDLNRLLARVNNATPENVMQVLRKVQDDVRDIQTRMLGQKLYNLLKMKTQDRNGKNMSVAKNVSNDVRIILDNVKDRMYGVMVTDADDAIGTLRSENYRLREQARRTAVVIAREGWVQGSSEYNEALGAIHKANATIDTNNARIKELEAEKTRTIAENLNFQGGDIEKQIEDKLQYMQECVEPDSEKHWTQEDSRELTTLEILRARMDIENTDVQIRNWEKQKAGASVSKRRALDGVIDDLKRQRLIKVQALVDKVENVIDGGKTSLQMRKANEINHRRELVENMMRDIDGGNGKKRTERDMRKRQKESTLKRWATAQLGSFEYMAHRIDVNHMSHDGWFYRTFVTGKEGVMEAENTYQRHIREDMQSLQAKTEEIYGKKVEKVAEEQNKRYDETPITLQRQYPDGTPAERVPINDLSKAEATYLWMVWKMPDGRYKMQHEGYDERSMAEIREFIGEDNVTWAEWVQSEYLPSIFKRYNARYEEMYGTPMTATENYVPLRYHPDDIAEKTDMSGDMVKFDTMQVKNGSMINRTVNLNRISRTTNAFNLICEHTNEAEEYNAFARVRKDLEDILNSKAVQRELNANVAGQFGQLRDAAAVAVHAHRDGSTDGLDAAFGKISKGLIVANIAFRNSTALKQILSVPAFLGYSQDPRFVAAFIKNAGVEYAKNAPAVAATMATFGFSYNKMVERMRQGKSGLGSTGLSGTMAWCIENMPSFRDRVMKGNMGIEALNVDMTDAGKFEKALDTYLQYGMNSNKLIDAITCSVGIKSIYDYRYARLKSSGVDDAEAKRIALMEADIYYNGTQQSNHKAFMSPMQISRTSLNRMLSVYQNASIGFARKFAEGMQNLAKAKDVNRMVELYKGEMMAEGMLEPEAAKAAKEKVWGQVRRALVTAAVYGIGTNLIWDVGSRGLIGLFQSEEEKEQAFAWTSVLSYPMRGMPLFNAGASLVKAGQEIASGESTDALQYNPMLAITTVNDMFKSLGRTAKDYGMSPMLAIQVLNKGLSFAGFRPEIWANTTMAVYDLVANGIIKGEDVDKMTDLMLFLQTPNSLRPSVAKQLYGIDPDSLEGMSDEERDAAMTKYVESILYAMKYVDEGTPGMYIPGMKVLKVEQKDKVIKQLIDEVVPKEILDRAAQNNPELAKEMKDLKSSAELAERYDSEGDARKRLQIAREMARQMKIETEAEQSNEERVSKVLGTYFGSLAGSSKQQKVREAYAMVANAADVREDILVSGYLKQMREELVVPTESMSEDEKAAFEERNMADIELYDEVKSLNRQINGLKRQMIEEGAETGELMKEIRELREEAMKIVRGKK